MKIAINQKENTRSQIVTLNDANLKSQIVTSSSEDGRRCTLNAHPTKMGFMHHE